VYPISLFIKNCGDSQIQYARKGGIRYMVVQWQGSEGLHLFKELLTNFNFTETNKKCPMEGEYSFESNWITASFGDDIDLASEVIAKSLISVFGFNKNQKLEFKYIGGRDGCMGCCATGLIPTFILFLPFMTLFPSKSILLNLVNFHQKVTSPRLNNLNFKCRYEPSCSEYGKLAIAKYGAIKGGWKSIARICRCVPNSKVNPIDYP
jgi:hypothetical protein